MTMIPEMSEMAAHYADHPGTAEAAASLRSPVGGVRPQWQALPAMPSPGHTPRRPTLNNRLSALAQSAWVQSYAAGESGIGFAEPVRLAFRSLLGSVEVPGGYALNLEYVYSSPRGCQYVVTGVAWGEASGPLTGRGWARACTCPDFTKKRGPARDQISGPARCCKHMRLLVLLIGQWQGCLPWMGGVPSLHQRPSEGFTLLPFGGPQPPTPADDAYLSALEDERQAGACE